ncbi:MAG: hypothetical protein QF464_15250 [Myxococcota bacterium]|jgi:hypothetical protein|nr:hypothetical protein [Myxococcota bacterium]
MGQNKEGEAEPVTGRDRTLAVIEPEGDNGVLTKLVLMNKPKPPEKRSDEAPNIKWVLEPIVARPGRGRGQTPPSIGSMKVPGKP